MKYRKRQIPIEPIEVEACQVEDYDLYYARKHYPDWLVKRTYFIIGDDSKIVGVNIPITGKVVTNRYQSEDAYLGDYVVKEQNGEIHAIARHKFKELFEEVAEVNDET